MFRQSFENKASQEVREAKGIVEASSSDVPFGTLKQICSSAIVYSLYAPRPFISPIDFLSTEPAVGGRLDRRSHTSPYQPCYDVAPLEACDSISELLNSANKVATEDCVVSKDVCVEGLD